MKNNKDSIPKFHTFTQISTKQIKNITYDNSMFDLIDNTFSDEQMVLTAGDISD